jgi:hypothetical protein
MKCNRESFSSKLFPNAIKKWSAAKIALKQRKKEIFASPRSPKSSRKSSNHAIDALDSRISLASEILIVCSFKSPGNFRNSRRLNEAKNTHQNAARVSCTLQSGERLYRDIIGFAAIFYLQHRISEPVMRAIFRLHTGHVC